MNYYLNMISEKLPALGARPPDSEAHGLAIGSYLLRV